MNETNTAVLPHKELKTSRLFALDYMRGLAALGIMFYHFSTWTFGEVDSSTIIGRIGIYGVSIFYVLSGLTLYHVYDKKLFEAAPAATGFSKLRDFYIKRVFRIFPLLWLVTIVTIVGTSGHYDGYTIFLNLSGLFSIIQWDAYIGIGVWSIGNELVFYLFFPFFVYCSHKARPVFWLLVSTLLMCYLYFAFISLDPELRLSTQWVTYIHPINQVFLFLGGYMIGRYLSSVEVSSYVPFAIIIVCLFLFGWYGTSGDPITLVTGSSRIFFSCICFALCFAFYKMKDQAPKLIDSALSKLGEASYSVYLVHPIVWKIMQVVEAKLFGKAILPAGIEITFAAVGTVVTSYLVYLYFEKPFMRLGAKVARS